MPYLLWDFDKLKYHQWLTDHNINLPTPQPNSTLCAVEMNGRKLWVGNGIHDSSASLIPYVNGSQNNFILVSTGTWCINMNPFNTEPLTAQQLKSDCLCFLSATLKPIKSSRFFMGHIHEVNAQRLSSYFEVPVEYYKQVKLNNELLINYICHSGKERVFFKKRLFVPIT
ncbi:MAG: carbohydrate kinase, partial [Bacteroidales bacterium]|nr:carbohydrate kinase [Bacteroidales bacterium]